VAAFLGEPALPGLFEPQLLEIADDVVLLRGYERITHKGWKRKLYCGAGMAMRGCVIDAMAIIEMTWKGLGAADE
jgi:hypothetical protein